MKINTYKNTFFILIIFFLTSLGYSKPIYVATTGSDSAPNDGTIGKPYLTINKAAEVAVAGDIVIVKPGIYKPLTIIRVTNSGTPSAPIIFRSEVKDGAIIDGQVNIPSISSRQGLFTIQGTSTVPKRWIEVDGFRVINSQWAGIFARFSDNITIKNCSTLKTYASGIVSSNSTNITVLNNNVQQACIQPDINSGTNECITMASVDGFEVAYNTVSDRPVDLSKGGEGIDAKNSCTNGKIHHNIVFNLWRVGIYIDAYEKNISNIDVYANKVYNNRAGGITVGSEEGGTVQEIRIHDNIIHDMERVGIRISGYLNNGPVKNVDIYQNTIVRCGFKGGSFEDCGILIEATNTANTGFNIHSNIISECKTQIRDKGQKFPIKIENNLMFGGAAVKLGISTMNKDPMFMDSGAADFRLKAGSPAIGKASGFPLSVKDFNDKARLSEQSVGALEYDTSLSTDTFDDITKGIQLYPNPANDILNIVINADSGDELLIKIVDMQGKTLYNKNFTTQQNGINSIPLSVTGLTNSYYIVNLYNKTENDHLNKIFVKK